MTTGKLIAGIAAGAIIALVSIPTTRRLITDAISSLSDSLKNLTANQMEHEEQNLATGY
jgi:peptidase E